MLLDFWGYRRKGQVKLPFILNGEEGNGRWAPFLIKKTGMANKLLEKFEEMAKYI